LNVGVRYFDFRVGLPPSDPENFYFYHGYIGAKFEDVVE